jgi:hypothetical protein
VNLDYFSGISKDYTNKAGLSIWSWKLDHYGIYQSSFKQTNFYRKFVNKYLLTRGESHSEVFYNFHETKKQQYVNLFPINKIAISTYLESIVGSKDIEYCIVHIRRGDYLNVASRVISIDELTSLVKKIKYLLPKNILISKGKISRKFDRFYLSIHRAKRKSFFSSRLNENFKSLDCLKQHLFIFSRVIGQ